MDKRIGCSVCPLFSVEVDTLCEKYCSDMADYREEIRADAINNFVVNAITEFQKFDKEHGYPTLGDISVILSDVAEQLKEQNNAN